MVLLVIRGLVGPGSHRHHPNVTVRRQDLDAVFNDVSAMLRVDAQHFAAGAFLHLCHGLLQGQR